MHRLKEKQCRKEGGEKRKIDRKQEQIWFKLHTKNHGINVEKTVHFSFCTVYYSLVLKLTQVYVTLVCLVKK